jgi:hypothetical protein
MQSVVLSRLDLDQETGLRRIPPRAPEHRQPDYDGNFDFFTVLYDCFLSHDGSRIVCIGPPLLNLERRAAGAIERAFRKPFFSWGDRRRLDRNGQIWLKPSVAEAVFEKAPFVQRALKAQPNLCAMFRGKRVLLTKSKNNDLQWICDWVRFHVANHGCNAVLFYDNGSTEYGITELIETISSVPHLDALQVVSWPYIFGPQSGPGGIWDSDFGQYGVLEHAHHRFLAQADAVLNADVDELVVTKSGTSIFDLVHRSRTGLLNYAGVMIDNVTSEEIGSGMGRHAQFIYRKRELEPATRKWCVVPSRCPERSQWCVHSVADMAVDEETSSEVTHRHFRAIRTGWKYPRTPPQRPGEEHEVDEELVGWLRCIADGSSATGPGLVGGPQAS